MADQRRPRQACRRIAAAGLAFVLACGAAVADNPPAYQADLMRLSELIGTISYLDGLCGGGEAGRWRGEMSRLFDAQKLDDNGRRPYIAAFNRGLRSVVVAHRVCGAEARAVLDRFLAEGAGLAADIDKRFGGGAAGQPLPVR